MQSQMGMLLIKDRKQVGNRKYHAQPVVYISLVSNCAWNCTWCVYKDLCFQQRSRPSSIETHMNASFEKAFCHGRGQCALLLSIDAV